MKCVMERVFTLCITLFLLLMVVSCSLIEAKDVDYPNPVSLYESNELLELTEEEWQEDIDYLVDEVEKQQFYRENDPTVMAFMEHLNNFSYSENKYGNYIELLKAFSKLNDSHFYLEFESEKDWTLALFFQVIGDDLYIVNGLNGLEDVLGERVIKINGIEIKELISFSESISHGDNPIGKENNAIKRLSLPLVYELYFEKEVQKLVIETDKRVITVPFILIDDVIESYSLISIDFRNLTNFKEAYLSYTNQKSIEYISDDEKMIVQLNSFNKGNKDHMIEMAETVGQILQNQAIDDLIIDLRYCSGGYGTIFDLMEEVLLKNKDVDVYVFTSRNTYSYGGVLGEYLRDAYDAVIIGESNGSSPYTNELSNFDDELPNSGLVFKQSIAGSHPMKKNEIDRLIPDIEVQVTLDYYEMKSDPWMIAYEKVKNK